MATPFPDPSSRRSPSTATTDSGKSSTSGTDLAVVETRERRLGESSKIFRCRSATA